MDLINMSGGVMELVQHRPQYSIKGMKDTKGQLLLDHVCRELNLVEKSYFGLRYVDTEKQRRFEWLQKNNNYTFSTLQREEDQEEGDFDYSQDPNEGAGWHWLDPLKPVYRQLKHVNPMVLCFRVKFYPTDPMKLKEEITRYFLFLQLRRDLHHGRLLCSPQDANLLAAYIIQSEVGDYDTEDHPPGYVAQFKMLPKQTAKQEEKIAEIHKGMASNGGCTVPSEAESNFLKKACTLDTYGVDPHPVKDQKGNQMYLGVTHLGIVTFQGNKRTHLFKWPQINKIAFEGKMFIVHVSISEGEESSPTFKRKKHACGFKCPTFNACKHLWKCAVEQQYFFTLNQSSEAPKVTSSGGWFTRGSKFRFSGRCQKEVYNESANILRDPPQFERSLSNPQFVRSFNKLRSASMPIKFRDKSQEIGDVVENNHNSSTSTLPTMTRSHEMGDIVGDNVDQSIPEERAILVGDTPYEPLDSPQQENAPPFPVEDRDIGDLDSQIQDLQNQLDQCRLSTNPPGLDSNHSSSDGVIAMDSEVIENEIQPVNPAPQESAHQTTEPHLEPNGTKQANVAHEEPSKTSGVSAKRIAALTIMFLMLSLLLLVILVLETNYSIPGVTQIRQFPGVDNFKHHHYDPFKAHMAQKVGGWFKA